MAGLLIAPRAARRMWEATRRQEAAPPGTPATAPRHVSLPGVHAAYLIVISETVPAATWDRVNVKLAPAEFEAQIAIEHPDQDGSLTMDVHGYGTITGRSFYLTAVTVDPGMARLAWLLDGRLVVTDCTQFEL